MLKKKTWWPTDDLEIYLDDFDKEWIKTEYQDFEIITILKTIKILKIFRMLYLIKQCSKCAFQGSILVIYFLGKQFWGSNFKTEKTNSENVFFEKVV